MKDLTFQIFQQLLKIGLFKCVPGWITEIANNNSELKPVFLRLLNVGRSLLGKNPWRQILEIRVASLWFSENFVDFSRNFS